MKRRFRVAVTIFGILAGLTGYGMLSFEDQPIKLLFLFVLYGIAHLAFVEISWLYFERRQLTMIFDGQTIDSMKTIDTEKLWLEIQSRLKEADGKDEDDEDKTSHPEKP